MNRGYFNSSRAPFMYTGGEAVGPGMDCLQLRQPPGPFHYLINEQAKSLVALQELQHEVGALLEFRDLVIETFPNLRTKLASSTPATMTSSTGGGGGGEEGAGGRVGDGVNTTPQHHHHLHHHHHHTSNIPVSIRSSTSSSSASSSNVIITTTTTNPATSSTTVINEWTPGVRVRKKLGGSKDDTTTSSSAASSTTSTMRISSLNRKGGSSSGGGGGDISGGAIQDSGFSTETSSKETHSASSTVPPHSANTAGGADGDETEDELWNLLDIIHRKGTRLRDEVEALQGVIRERGHVDTTTSTSSTTAEEDFQRTLFRGGSADDLRQLRQERDLLLDRLAEMEAEVLAGRIHTSRLQEDLENLLTTKHDLEEQLKSQMMIIHNSSNNNNNDNNDDSNISNRMMTYDDDHDDDGNRTRRDSSQERHTINNKNNNKKAESVLDQVLNNGGTGSDRLPKVKVPDSGKFAAILREHDPIILQKHLLTSTVQNQVLHQQLDSAARLEMGLADKLDKAREENDELRFQLEDKNIELEGTRARVRMLEQLQKSLGQTSPSPDVVPDHISRTEISTPSMKAMSPLPLNLQMDHSSSTESAHDLAETATKRQQQQREQAVPPPIDLMRSRKPSKIPLKSYNAPKPPGSIGGGGGGGKHSPAPGARSRSGESPGRPHSAQSWRNNNNNNNRSETNSLTKNQTVNASLTKSRNGSLISARDSLTSKLRNGNDSLTKLSGNSGSFGGTTASVNAILLNSNSNNGSTTTVMVGSRGTLRKSSGGGGVGGSSSGSPGKWTNTGGGGNMNHHHNSSSGGSIGNIKETNGDKISSDSAKGKSRSPWTLSSFNSDIDAVYPDSLDRSLPITTTNETTSGSNRFQTANTFLWNAGASCGQSEFYDSIDSNFTSSLYQQNGEDLAECDSLEKRLSGFSDKK